MSFLTLEILRLFATNRPAFLIMVLLSHQFSKLQIYPVKVSNTFSSLHQLKEIFNDNANFALRKGILSSLLRDSQQPKRPDKIPQFKRDNLYTKIMQQKIQVSVLDKELKNSSRKQKIYVSNDCDAILRNHINELQQTKSSATTTYANIPRVDRFSQFFV